MRNYLSPTTEAHMNTPSCSPTMRPQKTGTPDQPHNRCHTHKNKPAFPTTSRTKSVHMNYPHTHMPATLSRIDCAAWWWLDSARCSLHQSNDHLPRYPLVPYCLYVVARFVLLMLSDVFSLVLGLLYDL